MCHGSIAGIRSRETIVAILGFLCAFEGVSARSYYFKPWKELFEELHPGEKPAWRNLDDAYAWARQEKDDLEPIALQILRGERQGRPWSSGLFIARVLPTQSIRDVLVERAEELSARLQREPLGHEPNDVSAFATIADIFADAKDNRLYPILVKLIVIEGQTHELLEHSVLALRSLGDASTVESIRSIDRRRRDQHFDQLCALTEKVLEAKGTGRDILANADSELRTVTSSWVAAIEAKDMQAYLDVLPFGARAGVDEHDFKVELLGSPELPKFLEAAKKVAQRGDFEIDGEKLEASIIVEGRIKFRYVLEADGWKIGGPVQIAP